MEGRAGAIPVLLVVRRPRRGLRQPGPRPAPTGARAPPRRHRPTASRRADPRRPGTTPGASPGVTVLPTDPPPRPRPAGRSSTCPPCPAIARLDGDAGRRDERRALDGVPAEQPDRHARPDARRPPRRVAGAQARAWPRSRDTTPCSGRPPRCARRRSTASSSGAPTAPPRPHGPCRPRGRCTCAHTLPGDSSSGVPRDTGIEITFDQPGVRLTDVREHVDDLAGRRRPLGAARRHVRLRPEQAARRQHPVHGHRPPRAAARRDRHDARRDAGRPLRDDGQGRLPGPRHRRPVAVRRSAGRARRDRPAPRPRTRTPRHA